MCANILVVWECACVVMGLPLLRDRPGNRSYFTHFQQGGKVGSGRRAGGTALRAWTGVGGCIGSIPRPCILPLSPPFMCNTVSKEVRCAYQRTLGDAPAALSRVPAVPLLATVSNTTTGEALRPRPTSPDRATSVRQAQTCLYAPFTCKVGVSSEERLSRKSGLARSEYGSKGRVRCTDAPQPLGRHNGLNQASWRGGPVTKLLLYNLCLARTNASLCLS